MKICAYVQEQYGKQAYKNECLESRQFVGLRVVIDSVERAGYSVEYAGIATVHQYDVVLVSLTSDCDWWTFIEERTRWQKGNYRVIIGGAGVLHVAPFLAFGDFFSLGRGEQNVVDIIRAIDGESIDIDDSVICSDTFSADKIYHIKQAEHPYEHTIDLPNGNRFTEATIGCNHKCLFCGYTWQRKFDSPHSVYRMDETLFGANNADRERALLDMAQNFNDVDFAHLRTTAIDGFSERLRYYVNKKISKETLTEFLTAMITSDAKPHQLKLYNLCGLPGETEEDWWEIVDVFKTTEKLQTSNGKQWSVVLHSTPFRAMPATPMACAPMSYKDYRGEIARVLGKGMKGNIFYQGKNLWAVESMGTDSLSTVILSAICHRGNVADTENITRIARAKKFWAANGAVKRATLEKYFDVDRLFGTFTPETLPSRYLRTYAKIENMWAKYGADCKEGAT